jgi:dihydroflavonol-4-reductase
MKIIPAPEIGMTSEQTVLVTGGSGYVGGWVVVELLRRGYRVRATIRDLAREGAVRAQIGSAVDAGDRLAILQADLLSDDGWMRAADGADYVIHVASPMPIGEFRGQDVIRPAREGTLRVLRAAKAGGAKRVVITSSTAAAQPPAGSNLVADETVWTDLPAKPIYNYPRAKTLAEQDAWAFVRQEGGEMQLSTVLPAQIQGPVLGADYSASVGLVTLMLNGKMPVTPRVGYNIVDVRDLAQLHLLAMTEAAAAGERFMAAGDFLWFSDMARILRENLGERGAKAPRRNLPDAVVRLAALFNPEMAQLAPSLGRRAMTSSAKAERLLGWRPRAAKDALLDTARSLIERGLV